MRRAFRSITMLTGMVLAGCSTEPADRVILNGDWSSTVHPKGGRVGTAGASGRVFDEAAVDLPGSTAE